MQRSTPLHKCSDRIKAVEIFTYRVTEGDGEMEILVQIMLPFKVEKTDELLTVNVGLERWLRQDVPPRRKRCTSPSVQHAYDWSLGRVGIDYP